MSVHTHIRTRSLAFSKCHEQVIWYTVHFYIHTVRTTYGIIRAQSRVSAVKCPYFRLVRFFCEIGVPVPSLLLLSLFDVQSFYTLLRCFVHFSRPSEFNCVQLIDMRGAHLLLERMVCYVRVFSSLLCVSAIHFCFNFLHLILLHTFLLCNDLLTR